MRKDQAKQRIIEEYRRRVSGGEALNVYSFAIEMANEYQFQCGGDKYQEIKTWLEGVIVNKPS